jgi:hypothetical protein
VHGWPVPDFGWRGSLRGQERGEASVGFAPREVGAGNVDVQAASPFRGGDVRDADVLGVVDSGSVVTENLRNAHLVKGDAGKGVCAVSSKQLGPSTARGEAGYGRRTPRFTAEAICHHAPGDIHVGQRARW